MRWHIREEPDRTRTIFIVQWASILDNFVSSANPMALSAYLSRDFSCGSGGCHVGIIAKRTVQRIPMHLIASP